MEDIEEMDDVRGKLKIPDDVLGQDDEEEEAEVEEEQEVFGKKTDDAEADEDIENEIFAQARENKEMHSNFTNKDMNTKIDKIEDEMMDKKKWQLLGEVQSKDRNYNSLLEEYVDFDTATKAPPEITQETTNEIEAMIKQRILDELFDDPLRKVHTDDKNDQNDFMLDFTKSHKGLGDQYADD